jgi:membrane-associated phospholipid phosphatase
MSANELLGPLHREHTTDQRVHPILATIGIAVVGFLVLAALTLAMGALVTQFVVGHGLGDADHDVARWFADHRTPSWNDVSAVGSDLAGTVTVLAILVVAIVLLGVRRKWAQIGLFTVSLSVEGTVYLVATYFVTRNRPAVPRLEALIVADSFPSGHTAASVALYGALAVCALSLTTKRWWRAAAIALAIVLPIVVATSRVYRGMHNPTDVFFGALIGAGCVVIGYVSVRAGVAEAHERDDRFSIRPGPTPEVVG